MGGGSQLQMALENLGEDWTCPLPIHLSSSKGMELYTKIGKFDCM